MSFCRASLRSARFALLSLLALAPAARAGVIVVDAGGGGMHTDLQAAVDAAQDGDVLLVKSGLYASFAVNDKALAIVGDAGAQVSVIGAVRVRNLAAGKSFLLANLDASGDPLASGTNRYGLFVTDCAGHVRVEDGAFLGADAHDPCTLPSTPAYDGVFVRSSSDVTLLRCDAMGGRTNWFAGGAGLRGTQSGLALYRTNVEGGDGFSACYDDGPAGAPGIQVSGPIFFAWKLSASGGFGGNGGTQVDCTYGGAGGAGVVIEAGTTAALRANVQLAGGPGGSSHFGSFGCASLPPGANGAPLVGSAETFSSTATRTLEVPTPVRESTTPSLHFVGKPGDRVGLLVSDASAFAYQPARQGVLLVEAASHLAMLIGEVPVSGVIDFPLALGDLGPGVESRLHHLQAFFVDTQDRLLLGEPATLLVLDSAY
jgi:hypothetical protein